MTDIILTPEHDLLIEDQDIKLFLTLEALTVQKVKINLLNYKGQWFRDINQGVPYLQEILGKRDSKLIADTNIKNTIMSTDNIENITSYNSEIDNNRKIIVTFSATMQAGGTIDDIIVEI